MPVLPVTAGVSRPIRAGWALVADRSQFALAVVPPSDRTSGRGRAAEMLSGLRKLRRQATVSEHPDPEMERKSINFENFYNSWKIGEPRALSQARSRERCNNTLWRIQGAANRAKISR